MMLRYTHQPSLVGWGWCVACVPASDVNHVSMPPIKPTASQPPLVGRSGVRGRSVHQPSPYGHGACTGRREEEHLRARVETQEARETAQMVAMIASGKATYWARERFCALNYSSPLFVKLLLCFRSNVVVPECVSSLEIVTFWRSPLRPSLIGGGDLLRGVGGSGRVNAPRR